MIYLPKGWLKKAENEAEVREILSDGSCFQNKKSLKEKEKALKKLGETKILKEFKKGTFAN